MNRRLAHLLSELNLGLKHRIELVLVILGVSNFNIACIDIYPNNDNPKLVKDALFDVGLMVEEVEVLDPNSKCLCRLVVGNKKEIISCFVDAYRKQNTKFMLILRGVPKESALVSDDDLIPFTEYPFDLKKDNPLVFKVSKKEQEKQFNLIRSNIKIIQLFAPILYEEMKKEKLV